MDRLIYTALTGAKQFMERQATVSHNLANANTTGFKAQVDVLRSTSIGTSPNGYATQVAADLAGISLAKGNLIQTGRMLDLAIEGDGWFVVKNNHGEEGFTRSGEFKISENGVLQTSSGMIVQGENGPISIQADMEILIDKEGVISTVQGSGLQAQTIIDKLKFYDLDDKSLVRGLDGLFYPKQTNFNPPLNNSVKVKPGYLESSNVNVIDAMVNMLNLSKQYDMQIEMIKTAQTIDSHAGQILSMN